MVYKGLREALWGTCRAHSHLRIKAGPQARLLKALPVDPPLNAARALLEVDDVSHRTPKAGSGIPAFPTTKHFHAKGVNGFQMISQKHNSMACLSLKYAYPPSLAVACTPEMCCQPPERQTTARHPHTKSKQTRCQLKKKTHSEG